MNSVKTPDPLQISKDEPKPPDAELYRPRQPRFSLPHFVYLHDFDEDFSCGLAMGRLLMTPLPPPLGRSFPQITFAKLHSEWIGISECTEHYARSDVSDV